MSVVKRTQLRTNNLFNKAMKKNKMSGFDRSKKGSLARKIAAGIVRSERG